jgi:C-terminal processing protease CtpA/Prc
VVKAFARFAVEARPLSATRAEEPRGTFGFAAKVDADGTLNPTLKSVFVHSVQPGMPAALAGIVAGDSIIEVEGAKVAGAKASAMADRMKKRPGEALALKLLRANGDRYVVTLTAVAPMALAPANAAPR